MDRRFSNFSGFSIIKPPSSVKTCVALPNLVTAYILFYTVIAYVQCVVML